MKTPAPLSACCRAPLKTHYGDEGTNCFLCGTCGKPCDLLPSEPEGESITPDNAWAESVKAMEPPEPDDIEKRISDIAFRHRGASSWDIAKELIVEDIPWLLSQLHQYRAENEVLREQNSGMLQDQLRLEREAKRYREALENIARCENGEGNATIRIAEAALAALQAVSLDDKPKEE